MYEFHKSLIPKNSRINFISKREILNTIVLIILGLNIVEGSKFLQKINRISPRTPRKITISNAGFRLANGVYELKTDSNYPVYEFGDFKIFYKTWTTSHDLFGNDVIRPDYWLLSRIHKTHDEHFYMNLAKSPGQLPFHPWHMASQVEMEYCYSGNAKPIPPISPQLDLVQLNKERLFDYKTEDEALIAMQKCSTVIPIEIKVTVEDGEDDANGTYLIDPKYRVSQIKGETPTSEWPSYRKDGHEVKRSLTAPFHWILRHKKGENRMSAIGVNKFYYINKSPNLKQLSKTSAMKIKWIKIPTIISINNAGSDEVNDNYAINEEDIRAGNEFPTFVSQKYKYLKIFRNAKALWVLEISRKINLNNFEANEWVFPYYVNNADNAVDLSANGWAMAHETEKNCYIHAKSPPPGHDLVRQTSIGTKTMDEHKAATVACSVNFGIYISNAGTKWVNGLYRYKSDTISLARYEHFDGPSSLDTMDNSSHESEIVWEPRFGVWIIYEKKNGKMLSMYFNTANTREDIPFVPWKVITEHSELGKANCNLFTKLPAPDIFDDNFSNDKVSSITAAQNRKHNKMLQVCSEGTERVRFKLQPFPGLPNTRHWSEDYVSIKLLQYSPGEGDTIYLAQQSTSTGISAKTKPLEYVILKVLEGNSVDGTDDDEMEIKMTIRAGGCPYVIEYKGMEGLGESPVRDQNGNPVLIAKYYGGKTMANMKTTLQKLKLFSQEREKIVWKNLPQIALALDCLHKEKDIIFWDLKLENVVIDQKGDAYIIDFVYATTSKEAAAWDATSDKLLYRMYINSGRYLPPEARRSEPGEIVYVDNFLKEKRQRTVEDRLQVYRAFDWWGFGFMAIQASGIMDDHWPSGAKEYLNSLRRGTGVSYNSYNFWAKQRRENWNPLAYKIFNLIIQITLNDNALVRTNPFCRIVMMQKYCYADS